MKIINILLVASFMIGSCEKERTNPQTPVNQGAQGDASWSIPRHQIYDGGPGKDGIPALTLPTFVSTEAASYLSDDDLVIGVKYGNTVKAYPHPILDWHEIINDDLENKAVSINYCPLTGTGIGWERTLNGAVTTFGVSGLLYNSNLILYDRSTDSHWSQMLLESVNGSLKGEKAETVAVVETSWQTWKTLYPNTQVVSVQTGFSRNYFQYPYGDYRTNHQNIIFPISQNDQRLPAKERVHGIILDGKAKAYRFHDFADSDVVVLEDDFNGTALEDDFNGTAMVLAGSQKHNFIVSFERTLPDGTLLSFTTVQEGETLQEKALLADNEGNHWDLFGHAIDGPRSGQKLTPTTSFIGYWFAWGAFYPGLDLYKAE